MTFSGGQGFWKAIGTVDQAGAEVLVKKCVDAGSNFFDTADVYSEGDSERMLGQALKNLKIPRKDIVIATKVFGRVGQGRNDVGASRGHIMDAVEASPKRDQYVASLQNAIQHAWIRPPSARVGVDCLVEVTQVPGGAVTGARVTQCNGDAAVRQSIENAVYRASPLPDPPDPALFQRNFAFRFKPND